MRIFVYAFALLCLLVASSCTQRNTVPAVTDPSGGGQQGNDASPSEGGAVAPASMLGLPRRR